MLQLYIVQIGVTDLEEVTSVPSFRRKPVALYSEKVGERKLDKLFWLQDCIQVVALLKRTFKVFL